MRIVISHTKSQPQMIEIIDRAVEDAMKGLVLSPIEVTNQHKIWHGSVMTFSLTARMGFLKSPVSGTVEVTPSDVIVIADLGILSKFIPGEKIQAAIKTRIGGLLT